MKYKIVLIVLLCAMVSICLLGCGQKVTNESDKKQESMFVTIESTNQWIIVRHKETGVIYAVSDGGYNRGIFTLLVNADGTPMIREDES